jgi:hypothetical protein
MESELERLDRQVVQMRTDGKSEAEISSLLGVTVADIHRAIDKRAAVVLSAQNRVRRIYLELQRLDELQVPFQKQAKAGDVASGALCVKIQERRATLMGLNAPLKVDPIALVEAAGARQTSTEQLRAVFDNLMAEDKQALRNGGPGYGDWRDDRDREDMARKAARAEE